VCVFGTIISKTNRFDVLLQTGYNVQEREGIAGVDLDSFVGIMSVFSWVISVVVYSSGQHSMGILKCMWGSAWTSY
jgi:hypothetical protein